MNTQNLQHELSQGADFHPTNRDSDDVIIDQAPAERKKIGFEDKVRINLAAKAAREEKYKDYLAPATVAYETGFKHGAIAEHENMLNK